MSNFEEEFAAGAQPMEEEPAAPVARRGKRRNCMVVPGSSNPLIAKMYAEALMKEVFPEKHQMDEENPENAGVI